MVADRPSLPRVATGPAARPPLGDIGDIAGGAGGAGGNGAERFTESRVAPPSTTPTTVRGLSIPGTGTDAEYSRSEP